MAYHFFEFNGLRYRAWTNATGTLFVEAVTRLGMKAAPDSDVRARAAEIIASDRAFDAAQKGN